MTERDFDKLLEAAAEENFPDDIVREVTPWRKAMGNVIGGSGMCAITINFLNLNILLPTIGVILQLLGFRGLRRENRWFTACWVLALLRAVLYLPTVVVNATIYRGVFYERFYQDMTAVSLVTQLLLFFCLWRGLWAAQRRASLPVKASSAGALLVWYLVVTALAWMEYSGWIVAILMLVCYVCILKSLSRLSQEMEEGGYAIQPARVRISDGAVVKGILIFLAVGITCGYLFFGSYPMDWRLEGGRLSAEVVEIRDELLALGYPEGALQDLSEEDILACRGALQVVVHETDEPVNDGREVRETWGNHTQVSTVYDVKELHMTDVAVELPGEREHWKIFHHFLWTVNPGFRGTESLQLWPAYTHFEGWAPEGQPTGRVLYDNPKGLTCSAPFYSLGTESYHTQSFLWGEQQVSDLFAVFSLPSRGEDQRGYVSYGIVVNRPGYIINSWINYTHQESRLQYPVLTARESRKRGGWNRSFPFVTVQNALQFFLRRMEST
ncbi:MAG: hypothetical protein HFF44_04235 [Lawsonibacter sp.]|nr:hypothetical protein [Lawsonibacter sp.]